MIEIRTKSAFYYRVRKKNKKIVLKKERGKRRKKGGKFAQRTKDIVSFHHCFLKLR